MSETSRDWRTKLVDGTRYDCLGVEDLGEALDVGVGHRRLRVTVAVDDGEVATVDVVLSPEQIADAFGGVDGDE